MAPTGVRIVTDDGSIIPRDQAERVGAVIHAITRRNGECSIDALLDAARDPRCPAHRDFDWDDKAAAFKWRNEQARRYLTEIRIEVSKASRPARPSAVTIRGPSTAPKRRPVDLGRVAMADALHELQTWRARHASFEVSPELGAVFAAIDDAVARAAMKRAG